MKSILKVLRYIFPKYWSYATLNFVFVLLSVVFGLFSFTMVIPFLDVLFGNAEFVQNPVPFELTKEAVSHNFNYYMSQVVIQYGKSAALAYVSIFVVVAVMLKTGFLYAAKLVMPPLYSGVIYDIRNDLFDKILNLPISYYSEERKGDIISRMTGDMHVIEASVIRSLDVVFKEPVTILIYLITLIILSPQLTLFVLIMLPVTALLIGGVGKNLRKSSTKAQDNLGELIALLEEALGGLKIIKSFNAEKKVYKRFWDINSNYRRWVIKLLRRNDLASPLSEFLGTAVVVFVLYYGGSMVINGEDNVLSPGALISFIVIFSQILNPAKSFSTAYYNIQKGMASIIRIEKILDAKSNIIEKEDAQIVQGFSEAIRYENVSFKYVDDLVLKNVSLEIPKGSTLALVGQSGSGKSTMADLLPRFYDVTEGRITLDGKDIRDCKIDSLRSVMGIVNQESILFNDTIFNNIAFGVASATEEQVIEAAKIANAHDFIMETPNGYQTNIGDRGGKLSGGQRQRLSIARAILANPPIMILDEATSALDTESEKIVQESLHNLMKNRTSLIIAHRLSTIMHADKICVMQEGVIVEEGSHEELIALDGYYKKLHDTQTFA